MSKFNDKLHLSEFIKDIRLYLEPIEILIEQCMRIVNLVVCR